MNARNAAIALFERTFDHAPAGVVRSPGRVNLMGDHTDYNNGFSLPMAIEPATWIAFASASKAEVTIVSTAERGTISYRLDSDERIGGWGNYVQGTTRAQGLTQGFQAAVASDLPIGAGLSSSASLELGIARIAAEVSGWHWDPMTAAMAGQLAENEWVGVATGLLDQISVSHAVAGEVLLIDFATLDVSSVALPTETTVFILDGGGSRDLVTSEYGRRRTTCERAALRLGITSLRELDVADLDDLELPDPELQRVRHVVTENARVHDTVAAFRNNDPHAAGRIMVESHKSLRDDYEVAGKAQDDVVAAALDSPGVYGARMTGGGFAGSAVALVASPKADVFATVLAEIYEEKTGVTPAVLPSAPAAGVVIDTITEQQRTTAGVLT